MRLATFRSSSADAPTIGAVIDDLILDLPAAAEAADRHLPGDMKAFLREGPEAMELGRRLVGSVRASETRPSLYRLGDIELLAPVPRPGKILHTSCNFDTHLEELTTWQAPEWQSHGWDGFHFEHPTGFLIAPSSVVGSGANIIRPVFTEQLDYEIELAIIIGRQAHRVSRQKAMDYVAGFAVFNDVSARDIQAREHANNVILLGKSFDTSAPLGPYLVTTDELDDPQNLKMTLRVNGEARQSARTADMHYGITDLVAWWSHITLEPGDVITSGSPPGVAAGMEDPAWLEPGDQIEATIEGLGTLRNGVVDEEPAQTDSPQPHLESPA